MVKFSNVPFVFILLWHFSVYPTKDEFFFSLHYSRKDSYEVDYCYEQNEENDLIFSREVKPLISGVFNGCNSTIIAYGARNTGKTSVIQVGSILLKFSFITNVDSSIVFFGITLFYDTLIWKVALIWVNIRCRRIHFQLLLSL